MPTSTSPRNSSNRLECRRNRTVEDRPASSVRQHVLSNVTADSIPRPSLTQTESRRIKFSRSEALRIATLRFKMISSHLCIVGWRRPGRNFFDVFSNLQSRDAVIVPASWKRNDCPQGPNGSPLIWDLFILVVLKARAQVQIAQIVGPSTGCHYVVVALTIAPTLPSGWIALLSGRHRCRYYISGNR